DQRRHDTAQRLDPERERRHVEEEHVLDVTRQHARLDRRADRDDLVRVHTLVGLLPEEVADDLLDLRDPRRTTDQDHLVDLRRLQTRVLQRLLHRLHRTLDQVVDELLELRTRERQVQMLRSLLRRRDERQVDVRRHRRRQLHLRLLRSLLQPLERHRVLGEVDPLVLLELLDQPVDDLLVEVIAAQVRVAVRRLDLKDAIAQLEDRDVERAAAQVVDRDDLVLRLVQAVGQRGRRRLVDDPQHLETRDPARVLRRLPLRVVEVRRDRDDRLRDLVAQVVLRRLLHLLEHHRGDLRRRERLPGVRQPNLDTTLRVRADLVRDVLRLRRNLLGTTAHEPLDRKDRVLGIRDRLTTSNLANQTLTILRERDDGRRRTPPLRVRNHDRVAPL